MRVSIINVVSKPELLSCFSLTHAVTVFRGNMPSAIKKSKVAVSAADSGKKKNKVEKYFMDNSWASLNVLFKPLAGALQGAEKRQANEG